MKFEIGRVPWEPCEGVTDVETLDYYDQPLIGKFKVANQDWLYICCSDPYDKAQRWDYYQLPWGFDIPEEFETIDNFRSWLQNFEETMTPSIVAVSDECKLKEVYYNEFLWALMSES